MTLWKTFIYLSFLNIWVFCPLTSGQIFSELKRISGSPSADREGRLMRLRTCHDGFVVQCEPCEVIRIVNASYAASRLHQRNPIQECSDVGSQDEFDCLHQGTDLYFDEITGSCDGIQVCQLKRIRSSVSCGFPSNTWSCCMGIYFNCESKSDNIQTANFLTSDFYGNVNGVSLQCQSSNLSIDSVVLAFNSSEEVQDGGICYKESENTKNLKRRCERRGCSGEYVPGARGCGENKHIFNHGIYVCYICKGRKVHQTIYIAPQSAAVGQTTVGQNFGLNEAETNNQSSMTTQSSTIANDRSQTSMPSQGEKRVTKSSETTMTITSKSSTTESSKTTTSSEITMSATATKSSSMSQSSTTSSLAVSSKWFSQENMWVIVGASLIVGVLLCLLVCRKKFRRRNRELGSRLLARIHRRKGAEPPRGSQSSDEEQEDYSYPEMSQICLQLNDARKYQNCEVGNHADDAESGLENESEHLDRVEIKELASTFCEESLRVLYENIDNGEETEYFDSSSSSNQVLDSRTYVEVVAGDDDDDDHYDDAGVGKGLEQDCTEQENFWKNLKPIEVGKKSNSDYVNSGMCREESKTVYEKVDQFGNNLNPVYEELNLSTMNENPVNTGK